MKQAGAVRGRVLCPHPRARRLDLIDDAVITLDGRGRIASVTPADADAPPETCPGAIWMPGLVDTHVHFPQTRVMGSASGPLLEWLERSVFPEEARFAERAYAEAVAADFCAALVRHGTTCASIFSSSHPEATDVLFRALDARGLRGQAGLTLMDREAPDAVRLDARPALESARALAARWDGHDEGRLRFCVTPRFALSCTPALLRGAADLAADLDLPIQTHLAENTDEVAAVRAAFPDSADYLGAYADHGLLRPGSLFAHCIWLDDGAWDRMASGGGAVSHCPDSNFFLGSGAMDLDAPTARGVPVGLGSDVGAGRTFSMRRVAARGYDASRIRGARADAETLLWLASRGGALALGQGDRIGCVAPGFEADLVAFPTAPEATDPDALMDSLVFRLDDVEASAVMVRGRWLRSPDGRGSASDQNGSSQAR